MSIRLIPFQTYAVWFDKCSICVPAADGVYIDDILVVSVDWESHLGHLKRLFSVLRKEGLTCKRKKCSFGKRRLEFLGHEVGDGVISVQAARVRAIKDNPYPLQRGS